MRRITLLTACTLALVAGCAGAAPPSQGTATASAPPPATVEPATSPDATATASAATGMLRLVVIGDSIPGEGTASDDSYGDLFAAGIEQRLGVPVHTEVLMGDTTDIVLAGLADGGSLATAVRDADIVVFTVGANEADLSTDQPAGTCASGSKPATCLAAVNPRLAANLEAILTRVDTLTAAHPTAVRLTSPDYNPFIGWSGAPTPTMGLDFYRQVADAYTDLVCRLAPEHGAKCVDFLHAFNGEDGTADAKALLEPDHLHPSLEGRQRIADLLLAAGLDPLR